jgi:hypothetical protein
MTNTYPCLADRAPDRTIALGEEAKSLLRRNEQKKMDASITVDLHPELLQMLHDMKNPNSRKV